MEIINIYINGWWHHKTDLNILYNNVIIENKIIKVKKWNGENDGIILISDKIDYDINNKYDNVLFGPHVSIYDIIKHKNYKGKNIYYNSLSNWVNILINNVLNNKYIIPVDIPFPIDYDNFLPRNKKKTIFYLF